MTDNYQEVTILLVEDDDIDAMCVERAFSKLKLVNPLKRVKNGEEALAVLRGDNADSPLRRPYILLLDLNMPVMGGLEFLHLLRADKTISDTIVFVLTTSSADEDRVKAYKENIAGYIVKSDVGSGFVKLIEMLDHFWRIVVLPS